MLVLTRTEGELIRIGHDITVVVIAVIGSKVRIGVEAPTTTKVHREEVYQAILDAETKKIPADAQVRP